MDGRRRTGMRLPSLDETDGAGTNQLLSPKERRTSRQQSILMGVPGRKRTGGSPDDGTPLSTPPRTIGRQSVALDSNPLNLPMIGRKVGQKRESRAFSIMDSDGPMAAQVITIFLCSPRKCFFRICSIERNESHVLFQLWIAIHQCYHTCSWLLISENQERFPSWIQIHHLVVVF